ncbi:MAG: glycosyltransferase [Nitrospirales bacterium]
MMTRAAETVVAPPCDGARQRIAFFMYRMSGGGAPRCAVKLANGLVSRGYDVDVVMVNEKSKYAESLLTGIRRVVLSQPQWGRLHAALYRHLPFRWIRVFLSALPLTRYLHVRPPDIIVAAGNRVLLTAVIAWRISGKPMPLILRATNFPSGNLNLWEPLRMIRDLYLRGRSRLVYRPATRTVAVSDGVAEEVVRLANLPREAITTVFEPVLDDSVAEKANTPLVHPWLEPGQPPVLLAVGRLRFQKDYPTLIKAFALVHNKRPVRLVILGAGPVRSRWQDMIAALGVESDVFFFGYAENPFAWMARASLFVLSSAWEGLGCVLIEALACGCPVVSTNCPSGPWEILSKGKYGRLVPCRDPAALAEAILATLDAPVDRQALRDRARVFDLETSIKGYIATFEQAIASHRSRGSVCAEHESRVSMSLRWFFQ